MNKYFDVKDKVYDITEIYPETIDIFVANGFEQLTDEKMRKLMGKTISLEMACKFKKVNLEIFEEKLVEAIDQARRDVDGTYFAEVKGMHGLIKVEVKIADKKIAKIQVLNHMETPGVGEVAVKEIPRHIIEKQSLAIDTVNGVRITSKAIIKAVEKCLIQAGADIDTYKVPLEKPSPKDIEERADVVIVGGGGAGLAAAVEAVNRGSTVILIEKVGFLGGNSIVSGGIYNTPDSQLQDYHLDERSESLESLITDAISEEPVSEDHRDLMEAVKADYEEYLKSDKTLFDSPNWFALQTWNGGDKVARLDMVKLLAFNALEELKELEEMGAGFNPWVIHGMGSLYPRTHSSTKPNGTAYIKAYWDALEGKDNFKLILDCEGKSLIQEGDRVTGINAIGRDGSKYILNANKGVILTTGGFAGNVKLRQEYCQGEKWPDLGPKVPTSNMPGVTGDGILMARDIGADLVDMNHIQLLPNCSPRTGATYDSVRGKGSNIFINKEGKRFVREDGRRDEMSRAVMAQTDGMMYFIMSADGVPDPNKEKAIGGQLLSYYLETNHAGYTSGDTLEQLAERIGVPTDNLKDTVEEFNKHAEFNMEDTFGRVSYAGKLENGPYYAYPRRPAVHYTLGGVSIDGKCRALRPDGSIIKGLYCAGEITGGIHGANRLGGNAIVEFVVFGKIAGAAAATD